MSRGKLSGGLERIRFHDYLFRVRRVRQLLADMGRLWYNRLETLNVSAIRGKFVGHPTRFVIHYDTSRCGLLYWLPFPTCKVQPDLVLCLPFLILKHFIRFLCGSYSGSSIYRVALNPCMSINVCSLS